MGACCANGSFISPFFNIHQFIRTTNNQRSHFWL